MATAKELLGKEVKIESTAIKEIQEEMKKIIKRVETGIKDNNINLQQQSSAQKAKENKEGVYRSVVSTSRFKLQKW